MKHQETLTFESDKPIEPELLIRLTEHLQQEGINVYFLDVDLYAIERCQKLIAEKGPSYVLSIERLQEAVLPRTESKDRRDLLVRILSSQLQSLSPSMDLVIVDPYFFPTNLRDRADYLSIFREVFSPVIPNIARVRFITKPEYDEGLYKSIEQELVALNPQIKVSHRTTNDFHDRFWIVDETKGLFIGTSLNGIGRKYALTDYIKDEDTAAITEELRRLNLL